MDKMRTEQKLVRLTVAAFSLMVFMLLFILSMDAVLARKTMLVDTSDLSTEQSALVQKAARLAKAGHSAEAKQLIQSSLSSAADVSTCLAMASAADTVGFKLQDSKRACLQKALSLAKTRDDYFRCALKARQVQVFDITADAVKQLLASANSKEELLDLARRAQEIAMNDVTHMSLEKAYAQTKDIPAAFQLAKQCRLLGDDELARKICREVIDDNQSAKDLIDLLPGLEEFKYPDANRYLLKRSLDYAKDVEDLKLIFDNARRLNEGDIQNLAGFRGRKLIQMQESVNSEAVNQELEKAKAKEKENSATKGPTSGF